MHRAVARQLALKILDSIWLLKDLSPAELEKRRTSLEYYLPRTRDPKRRAEILLELGRIDCLTGNVVKAAGRYHECLRLLRKAGDRLGMGKTLYYIVLLHIDQNNVGKAEEVLGECMAFAEECRSAWLKASCYSAMAKLQFLRGDYESAMNLSLEAFDMFAEVGDADGMGKTLQNACVAFMKKGMADKALELLENIRETWKGASRENYALTNLQLAAIYLMKGNVTKAEELMKKAECKVDRITALLDLLNSVIALAKGEKSNSLKMAERAKERIKKLGLKTDVVSEVIDTIRRLP